MSFRRTLVLKVMSRVEFPAMKYVRVSAALMLVVSGASITSAAEMPDGFSKTVQPFFQKYCQRCHSEKKQEGEFRLDSLSRDFGTESVAQIWGEVMFRINSGEMPPKAEPLG